MAEEELPRLHEASLPVELFRQGRGPGGTGPSSAVLSSGLVRSYRCKQLSIGQAWSSEGSDSYCTTLSEQPKYHLERLYVS